MSPNSWRWASRSADFQRAVSYAETAAGISSRWGVMQCNESTHSEMLLRVIVYSVRRIGPPQPNFFPASSANPATIRIVRELRL